MVLRKLNNQIYVHNACHTQKLNSNWIKDLEMKPESRKSTKKNRRNIQVLSLKVVSNNSIPLAKKTEILFHWQRNLMGLNQV